MATALAACSTRPLVVGQVVDLVDDGIVAFETDDDLDLVEKSLPANIKLLETLLVSDPGNARLQTLLARLYGSYAFGFVETRLEQKLLSDRPADGGMASRTALKDQVNRCYAKGFGYALAALESSVPGAGDAFASVGTVKPYLNRLGREQVPALFWYGFNLGGWVNRNLDSIRAVSRAHVVRSVMERVVQIDPTYNRGGAHLFLIAYFGSRPPMMGGSQVQATDHYRQLKKIVGDDDQLPDLIYGRYCLPQQQDRAAFLDLMRRIADHPASESDVALYNAIAARRAAIYLSAVDRLFEE